MTIAKEELLAFMMLDVLVPTHIHHARSIGLRDGSALASVGEHLCPQLESFTELLLESKRTFDGGAGYAAKRVPQFSPMLAQSPNANINCQVLDPSSRVIVGAEIIGCRSRSSASRPSSSPILFLIFRTHLRSISVFP